MPLPAFVLRLGRESDRGALARLAMEVVSEGRQFVYTDVDGVLAYWLDPRGQVIVAEQAGLVVGSYVVRPVQPGRGAHVGNAGYMVAQAARGQGLGRHLGLHSLDTARQAGYRALQFNFVVSTNAAAVELWKSLGFRIVGTLPQAFRTPEDELVDAFVFYREL